MENAELSVGSLANKQTIKREMKHLLAKVRTYFFFFSFRKWNDIRAMKCPHTMPYMETCNRFVTNWQVNILHGRIYKKNIIIIHKVKMLYDWKKPCAFFSFFAPLCFSFGLRVNSRSHTPNRHTHRPYIRYIFRISAVCMVNRLCLRALLHVIRTYYNLLIRYE